MKVQGIRFDKNTGKYIFDFTFDKTGDIIRLKLQPYNKKLAKRKGLDIYIAYKLLIKQGQKSIRKRLYNSIKNLDKDVIDQSSIQLMISKSIINFQREFYKLGQFDIIISPKSTSKILNLVINNIKNRAGNNTILAKDFIVKNTIQNIKFDDDYINQDDGNIYKMYKLATKTGTFNIKKIPVAFREKFSNYLVFNRQADRRIFNAIANGKILIVDDIFTTGTTLTQINKLLVSYSAGQTIYYIFLLSQ